MISGVGHKTYRKRFYGKAENCVSELEFWELVDMWKKGEQLQSKSPSQHFSATQTSCINAIQPADNFIHNKKPIKALISSCNAFQQFLSYQWLFYDFAFPQLIYLLFNDSWSVCAKSSFQSSIYNFCNCSSKLSFLLLQSFCGMN